MNLDNRYPHPYQGHSGYTDSFGVAHPHAVNGAAVEMMNPYASGPQVISGPVGSAACNAAWGGVYSSSPAVASAPVSEEVYDTSNAQM